MKVDYGVRILVYLASFPQESIVKATDISKQRHIPEKFLFQISNDLIDKNLIKSLRGQKVDILWLEMHQIFQLQT